jgi:uncharacterized membrane protein
MKKINNYEKILLLMLVVLVAIGAMPNVQPYNIISQFIYLALIFIVILLVLNLFQRINVKLDDYFIIALVPYIIFGSFFRVLGDTGAIEPPIRYLFITPIVYVVTLSIAMILLLLTKGIAPKLNIHDWRVLFGGMGIVLCISVLVLLLSGMYRVEWVHPEVFLWSLGLGTGLILLIFGVSRFFGFSLMANKLNAIILWAHILNTISTLIGVNLFGYYSRGSPFMGIPLWTYLILPILWILDTKFKNSDTLRNFLKFTILYIGLTPAMRNILRLVLGV